MQKTADEMRISDWSSDVCSSDLDFVGGLLLAAFGAATVVSASGYPLGTTARLGPCYFPLMVGGLIVVLGLILAIRALVRSEERRVGKELVSTCSSRCSP